MTNKYSGIYSPHGNRKLGRSVGSVNRMPGGTCPGASSWCEGACYAKAFMYKVRGIHNRYQAETIELPNKLPRLVRIHAAGDFDSVAYIEWWIDVVRAHPDVRFWAYTRSWVIDDLLPALERLRVEPNVQLFASTDPGMAEPPTGWRIAYIAPDPRFRGMPCLEQVHTDQCETPCRAKTHVGKMPDCKTCGYCFIKERGNVSFNEH